MHGAFIISSFFTAVKKKSKEHRYASPNFRHLSYDLCKWVEGHENTHKLKMICISPNVNHFCSQMCLFTYLSVSFILPGKTLKVAVSCVCVFKGWLERWHHGHMEILGKVRIAKHIEAAHPRDRSTHAHSLVAEVSRLIFTGSGIALGGSRNEAWSQNWATPQQENVKSHLAALKIINHHLYYLLEPAHTHACKKKWRSQECALFP